MQSIAIGWKFLFRCIFSCLFISIAVYFFFATALIKDPAVNETTERDKRKWQYQRFIYLNRKKSTVDGSVDSGGCAYIAGSKLAALCFSFQPKRCEWLGGTRRNGLRTKLNECVAIFKQSFVYISSLYHSRYHFHSTTSVKQPSYYKWTS